MEMKDWKILLVDDEIEFITTLAERLELRGISARVVHDGMAALEAAARGSLSRSVPAGMEWSPFQSCTAVPVAVALLVPGLRPGRRWPGPGC